VKKSVIVLISSVVLLIIFLLSLFVWTMNINRKEIVLKNKLEAQINIVETTLDTMVKKIVN
jgi:sensor domain CHASE-containing protein